MSATFADFHAKPQNHGLVIFNIPKDVPVADIRRELAAFGGLEYFDRHNVSTVEGPHAGTYSCKATFLLRDAADAARTALNGSIKGGRRLRVERRSVMKGKRGLYPHKTCVRLLNEELPLRWSTTVLAVTTGTLKPVASETSAVHASGRGAGASTVSSVAAPGGTGGVAAFYGGPAPAPMEAQGGRMLLHRSVLRSLGPSAFPGRAGGGAAATTTVAGALGMKEDNGLPLEDGADADDEVSNGAFGGRFILRGGRGSGRAGHADLEHDNDDYDDDDDDAAGGLAGGPVASGAGSEAAVDARRHRWVKDGVGRRADWSAAFASTRFAGAGLPLRHPLDASRGAPPLCWRSGVVPIPVQGQLPPPRSEGSGPGSGSGSRSGSVSGPIPGSSVCAHVSVLLTVHGSDGWTDHVQGIGGCSGPRSTADFSTGSASGSAAAAASSAASGSSSASGGTGGGTGGGRGVAAWRPCTMQHRGVGSRTGPGGKRKVNVYDASDEAEGEGEGHGAAGLGSSAPLRLHTGALVPGRYRHLFGGSGHATAAAGEGVGAVGASGEAACLAGPYTSNKDDGAPRVGRPAQRLYASVSSHSYGGADYDDDDDDEEDGDIDDEDDGSSFEEDEGGAGGKVDHAEYDVAGALPARHRHHDALPRAMPMAMAVQMAMPCAGQSTLTEHMDADADADADIDADADDRLADEGAVAMDAPFVDHHEEDIGTAACGAIDDCWASCASSCSGCRDGASRAIGDEGEHDDGSGDDWSSNSSAEDEHEHEHEHEHQTVDAGSAAADAAVATNGAYIGPSFGLGLGMRSGMGMGVRISLREGLDDNGTSLPPAPAAAPARPQVCFPSASDDLPAIAAAGGHAPAAGVVNLCDKLEEFTHAAALEESYAANGNAAAAARVKKLRAQLSKLEAQTDRRGIEAAWAARSYSNDDVVQGKPLLRATEMALRDACRQIMLRRASVPAAGDADSEA